MKNSFELPNGPPFGSDFVSHPTLKPYINDASFSILASLNAQ